MRDFVGIQPWPVMSVDGQWFVGWKVRCVDNLDWSLSLLYPFLPLISPTLFSSGLHMSYSFAENC